MGKLIREGMKRQDEAGWLEDQALAGQAHRRQVPGYWFQSLTTLASVFRLSPAHSFETSVSQDCFFALAGRGVARSGVFRKDFRGGRVPGSVVPEKGMVRARSGDVIESKLRKDFEFLTVKSMWTRSGRSGQVALSPPLMLHESIPERLGGDV